VRASGGADVKLACCTIADSSQQSGFSVAGKGTRVEAQGTTFRGNSECGVDVSDMASARLEECMAEHNWSNNVEAPGGTICNLVSCNVANSLMSGLWIYGEGTRVEAKKAEFRGNVMHGVYVLVAADAEASVQLNKCAFIDGNGVWCDGEAEHDRSVRVDGKPVKKEALYLRALLAFSCSRGDARRVT
jgi:hypothetical protein